MSGNPVNWADESSSDLVPPDLGPLRAMAERTELAIMLHGGDPDTAQRAFADRLAKELDSRGTVDVLRRGVIDLGVTIQLAYFRPAHGLTPELVRRYDA